MESVTIKLNIKLNEQVARYASIKGINKSQAIRNLIIQSLDVTAHESELLKEIKSLRNDVKDHHNFNKKGFDRLASLSVKNGKKIFSIWHAVLIQVFLRSKDKNLDDNMCVKSRDDVQKTADCIYRSTWTPMSETLGHLDKNIF